MNPLLVRAVVSNWRPLTKALLLVGAVFILTLGVPFLLLVSAVDDDPGAGDPVSTEFSGCVVVDGKDVPLVTGLNAEQTSNAATIISVAKGLGIPAKGWTIGIAVALVESELNADLDETESDLDSAGLFQQRAAWAPLADRMDPVKSATMFYTGGQAGQHGLLDIPGWESMPLTVAAQTVQVSGFPLAYALREQQAATIVTALSGVDAGVCTLQAGATGPWRAPIAKGSYTLTSNYGMRVNPVTGVFRLHAGADLAAPTGTPIMSACTGKVTAAGPSGGYGNLVEVTCGTVVTRYGHMSRIGATAGAAVKAGDNIGAVGSTGNSTGPHLHFETRPNSVPTDPIPFMTSKGVTL